MEIKKITENKDGSATILVVYTNKELTAIMQKYCEDALLETIKTKKNTLHKTKRATAKR